MLLNKSLKALVVCGAILGLISCCKNDDKCVSDTTVVSSTSIEPMDSLDKKDLTSETELTLLEKKVVYFAHNSYTLSPQAQTIIAAHAQNLLKNPSLNLHIAGHSDKRGSDAYNLKLSELRAKEVASALEASGVAANRLYVVSYGNKRPVVSGNSEQALSQNRRVELTYEEKT